jgi:DNA-binding NtrC family response regulator
MRVLIVDDDYRALASLEAVLDTDNEVTGCASPLRALETAKAEGAAGRPFDVVCSDLRMPEMDGAELLRRMASLPDPPACILITGHVEVLTGAHHRAEHILGIIVKPYEPEHMIALVGRLGRITRMNRSVKRLAARVAGAASSRTVGQQ